MRIVLHNKLAVEDGGADKTYSGRLLETAKKSRWQLTKRLGWVNIALGLVSLRHVGGGILSNGASHTLSNPFQTASATPHTHLHTVTNRVTRPSKAPVTVFVIAAKAA